MRTLQILSLDLAAMLLAAIPVAAVAGTPPAAPGTPAPSAASPVAGWDALVDSLHTLPERMLAKLPETMRSDPQIRQEVGRLTLEALAAASIAAVGGDGDAPRFLPTINDLLNVGQPNADTIYRTARLTPGGSYRISGKRGSLKLTVMAQFVMPGAAGAGMRSQLDFSTLRTDVKGRFDLLLSATRPEGYTGDWWQLDPGATGLMLRMVSSDWGKEEDPALSIERLDKPIRRTRPTAMVLEQRLRALPAAIDSMALRFVDHVETLRRQGVVNQLKVFNVPVGGLAGQFYYEGVYDLADDEALIVSSPLPKTCTYRSLILTNEIYETTDWINNHASLNADQAPPDADGKLRIVVSARDPGVRNWLDTSGYPRGIIQGRWTGCDSQPIPEVRKVKVKDVLAAMPSGVATVTPAERQAILRARRDAYLERPFW
ncbi:MAG: hypothetical protein ABIT04_08585 [Novosphingobium sp.]